MIEAKEQQLPLCERRFAKQWAKAQRQSQFKDRLRESCRKNITAE